MHFIRQVFLSLSLSSRLVTLSAAVVLRRRSCTELPENFIIKLVLNANPVSRKRVENGEFCLRTNGNGTDLNRNWDAGWVKETGFGPETYPGKYTQTKLLATLIYPQGPTLSANKNLK